MESSDEEEVLEFVARRPNRAAYALHSTDVDDVSFGDIEKLLDKIERVQKDLDLYDQR